MTAIISHQRCLILHVHHGEEDARSVSLTGFLSSIVAATGCPYHHFSSQWIDRQSLSDVVSKLKQAASTNTRTTLLLCGAYLEDQVTVCALEALMEGLDVHLLCDVIDARDPKLKPVVLMRLAQAGAVPASLRQFIYIWHAAETEKNIAETLRHILHDYDQNALWRPA